MTTFAILSLAIAVLLLLVALRAAVGSFRVMAEDRGPGRTLLAVHEAAKSGFWFALAAFFAGSALLDDPEGLRWFLLVPISLAGIRFLSATLLAR